MPGIPDLICKILGEAQNILILPRSEGGHVGSDLDPAERAHDVYRHGQSTFQCGPHVEPASQTTCRGVPAISCLPCRPGLAVPSPLTYVYAHITLNRHHCPYILPSTSPSPTWISKIWIDLEEMCISSLPVRVHMQSCAVYVLLPGLSLHQDNLCFLEKDLAIVPDERGSGTQGRVHTPRVAARARASSALPRPAPRAKMLRQSSTCLSSPPA